MATTGQDSPGSGTETAPYQTLAVSPAFTQALSPSQRGHRGLRHVAQHEHHHVPRPRLAARRARFRCYSGGEDEYRGVGGPLRISRSVDPHPLARAFIYETGMPGPLGRAGMVKWIRKATTCFFHPTSTCRMGVDERSMVDPRLRVHGRREGVRHFVKRELHGDRRVLRVADHSCSGWRSVAPRRCR